VSEIEIGKTYEYTGFARSMEGRKALVFGQMSEGVYEIRWPNGREQLLFTSNLRGPVEPATPGVDEPCLVCGSTQVIHFEGGEESGEPLRRIPGGRPCPNCT
jgi:hypothetical protein